MIAVESNIPVPLGWARKKYPFHEMEVGQSFFVPEGNWNSLAASASRYSKTLARTFKTGKVQGGVRVWRTA